MDTSSNQNTQRNQSFMIPDEQLSPCQISAFGMPVSPRPVTSLGSSWTSAVVTDLTIGTSMIVRLRKVAAKGHVAFTAYVPGIHTWSPPVC